MSEPIDNHDKNASSHTLKRGLSNRHIQLIALGGAIGTGLFLAAGSTITMAGPSVLLGYAICGFIAFLIMRQLGEMVVEEPVAGSFSYFAYRYWSKFWGFSSGWNYWILFVLVSMTELTAVGKYIQFWWPEIPAWLSALFFFIVINAINLANVRFYGESEFWFSFIKIAAIIAMILFGLYLLFNSSASDQVTVKNLWQHGGFFPNGISGLIFAIPFIMFSFGGLELIGITAAEANAPQKTIPKATNQVIYRILIFYIGALAILLSLYPWSDIQKESSPFVLVFHNLPENIEWHIFGIRFAINNLVANVLNIVILSAAISVYNSSVYCNSRMLYGLSKQKNGPQFLGKTGKRNVPTNSICFSALIAFLGLAITYITSYFTNIDPFETLVYFVVSSLILNWIMISATHLKFKYHKIKLNEKTHFPSLFFPWANYLCLAFLVAILGIMYYLGMALSVWLIPIWLGVLAMIFYLKIDQK